ncbi:MAG: undecaprenyl-diphosphatase UppP [Gaiellaceae bacterium MAG52_C11]|nr:undecaprenyl-diphosphatase UppP [Candidatus Gaiellasilicea maunaloa]
MDRAGVYAVAGAAFLAALVLTVLGIGDSADALPNWQALVLGLVQGATELLPISSSGHLILVPWLFDWEFLKENDAFNQTFDVSLHLGTLIAVVAYFREDILRLAGAWLGSVRRRRIGTVDERIAWLVAIATVPAALVGALGETLIAENLGEPWQIAILLALFGGLLWLADRQPESRRMGDLGLRSAVTVGLAQCLSLMPGVSRSGITITAGRFLGLDRDSAARFSFLLLVPITFGAVAYKGIGDVVLADLPPGTTGPFLVGSLASGASGLLAISALLGYVRRHDYSLFVVYRLLAAAFVLLSIATGFRSAGF